MITVQGTIVRGRMSFKDDGKPKRIWDNYIVIGDVRKSDHIKLVIAAATRDGVRYINIREFYERHSDGAWKPGHDGITIPLVIPIENGTKRLETYIGFMDLLHQASNTAFNMELANEANAIYRKEKKYEDQGPGSEQGIRYTARCTIRTVKNDQSTQALSIPGTV